MIHDRPLKMAECLAASLLRIQKAMWPKLIERFQETLELQGIEGTLSLSGRNLVLAAAERRHVIPIG